MKPTFLTRLLSVVLMVAIGIAPLPALADDIDIFTGASAGAANNPNILVVIDNSANWSANAQHWEPSGTKQGEAELKALAALSCELSADVNFGMAMFTEGTGGTGSGPGGPGAYIRYHLRPMTSANKSAFQEMLLGSWLTVSGSATNNSKTLTSSAAFGSVAVNMLVTGPGLPCGTTVTAKASNSSLTLSNVASIPVSTTMPQTYSFGPLSSCSGNNSITGKPNCITQNFDTPTEKVGTAKIDYSAGMFEVFKYFGGYTSPAHARDNVAGTPTNSSHFGPARYQGDPDTKTDPAAYAGGPGSPNSASWQSPITSSNSCGRNYVIFIGNGYPNQDSPASLLTGVGGNATQVLAPDYTTVSGTMQTLLGTGDYASQAACEAAALTTYGANYNSYSCVATGTNTETALGSVSSCGAYASESACISAAASAYPGYGDYACSATACSGTVNLGTSTCGEYADQGACVAALVAAYPVASGYSSHTCNSSALVCGGGTTSLGSTACGKFATKAACENSTSGAVTLWPGYATYTCTSSGSCNSSDLDGAACYASSASCQTSVLSANSGYNSVACSSGTSCNQVTTTCAAANAYNTTAKCDAGGVALLPAGTYTGYTCSAGSNCTGGKTWTITGTTGTNRYSAIGTGTTFAVTGTTASSGSRFDKSVVGSGSSWQMKGLTPQWRIYGNRTIVTNSLTGTYSSTSGSNTDEWAKFLYQTDVSAEGGQQNIRTYTIDVFKDAPEANQHKLLLSMARQGGGKYFTAQSQEMILDALRNIVAEIQSVNTTFASASLPVNATNRSQNANQVFIGQFRPDPNAAPRWFGNMKQYQVGKVNGSLDLVDADGNPATNSQTGFISDCARSFWTRDETGNGTNPGYWESVIVDPSPASACTTAGTQIYSDKPDGSTVEKGAVASVIRRGNNPGTTASPGGTDTTPTWAVNRTIYTRNSSNALLTFSTANTGLGADLVNFTRGHDVNVPDDSAVAGTAEHLTEQTSATYKATTASNTVRPSVHGDVVHSRPLPVNYGSAYSGGVIAFYGANDGTFRAVDSENGKELWAFIPPEFNSRLERLMYNSPLVNYPSLSGSITPTPTKKDYFFDGSTGLLQNGDSSQVWIYPAQRRGGRMLYGMDVSTPTSPTIKWRQGCETNSTSTDIGCTTGMSGIGQTWSTPALARIKGYSTTSSGTTTYPPVVIVGGGYDTCEDADTSTPTCSSPKGAKIYILDADTGALVTSIPFSTERSVVADISLTDIDGDQMVDYAYVADTGGNLYRIDFLASYTSKTALAPADWTMHKVAYTNGGGRKFLFSSAVLPYQGSVYVAMASGDREHPLGSNYPYTLSATNPSRAYVYLDPLTSSTTVYNTTTTPCTVNGTTCLAPCDLDSDSCTWDYSTPVTCTDNVPDVVRAKVVPGAARKGWRKNLNRYGQGEQAVTSTLIAGGAVTFSTNRPIAASAGTCASALGEARGYWVGLLDASGAITDDGNVCTATDSSTFVGGGLPPSPVFGVVPVDGVPTLVVIGAPSRKPSDGVTVSPVKPTEFKPAVSATRTRKYQYQRVDR